MPSPHGITDLLGWFQNYLEYNPGFFSRPERPPAYQQDPLDRAAGDLLHDSTPVEYSHLGMHKAVGDMRRRDDAMSVSPLWDEMTGNAARYLLRNPADWPNLGWEPFSDYRQAVGELGIEGLQAVLAEAGLGVLEPGPGDAMRSLGALFGIPLSLQKMIAKRIHPSTVGSDNLPYQMYHGTDAHFDFAGRESPARIGSGHHMTRTGEYASTYSPHAESVVPDDPGEAWLRGQDWFRPQVRMESPALRRPIVRGQPMPVSEREVNEFATAFMHELDLAGRSLVLPDDARMGIQIRLEHFANKALEQGAMTPADLNQFLYDTAGVYFDAVEDAPWDIINEVASNAFLRIGIDGYIDPTGVGRSVPFTHRGVSEPSGEFVSFDPDRSVVRASHPEDAIRWLLRQPDLTVGERAEVLQAVEELGLQELFQHLSGGGQ